MNPDQCIETYVSLSIFLPVHIMIKLYLWYLHIYLAALHSRCLSTLTNEIVATREDIVKLITWITDTKTTKPRHNEAEAKHCIINGICCMWRIIPHMYSTLHEYPHYWFSFVLPWLVKHLSNTSKTKKKESNKSHKLSKNHTYYQTTTSHNQTVRIFDI